MESSRSPLAKTLVTTFHRPLQRIGKVHASRLQRVGTLIFCRAILTVEMTFRVGRPR